MFDSIAIDWGTKKYGIALGDTKTGLVTPYQIVLIDEFEQFFQAILKIKPSLHNCIISSNKNFSGGETTNSQASHSFAIDLQKSYPALQVIEYNERGTTANYGKVQDHYAAASLLTAYFRFVLHIPMEENSF